MKRAAERSCLISSDDSSDSDSDDNRPTGTKPTSKNGVPNKTKDTALESLLLKRAEMYQEYMKNIPIPSLRGSVIPFTSWRGLGWSVKQLYKQPLHYLTNILLKHWDQLRLGSDDELISLDTVIHPVKAESLIWITEEVHRSTTSHHHLAKLWASDPMYHVGIDRIFPDFRET